MIRLSMIAFALLILARTADADGPEPASADLDRLLRLIVTGRSVENVQLHRLTPTSETTHERWINEFEELRRRAAPRRNSGDPAARAVAEAIKRLEPVADAIKTSLSELEALREQNAEFDREIGHIRGKFRRMQTSSYTQYSEEQLEELRQRGGEFENKVNEFRRRRAELARAEDMETRPMHAAMAKNSRAAMDRIRPLLWEAEVRRNAVAADVLIPALRARSGPEAAGTGLNVMFSTIIRTGVYDKIGYLVVESHLPAELTQLTLLVKIATSAGDRVVAIYIPRLPPNGTLRLSPVDLSGAIVSGNRSYAGERPKVIDVRYAAWCSQFRAERLDAKILTPEEMVRQLWLQAVRPGSVYVSRGGTKPQMSVSEIAAARRSDPNWRLESEPDRRFEITFTTLTKANTNYAVEFELRDHQASGGVRRCRATFQMPTIALGNSGDVKFGEVRPPEETALILKGRLGTEEMKLSLLGSWNTTQRHWLASGGSATGRRFVPAGEIPTADSPDGIAKQHLAAAMNLAKDGNFDEARTALEKIVADYPDTNWETAAKLALSRLEAMKEGREKADEARERAEQFRQRMTNSPAASGLPAAGSPAPTKPLSRDEARAQAKQQAAKNQQALSLLNQGKQALARKNNEMARTYLRQTIALAPDSPAAKQAERLIKNLDK